MEIISVLMVFFIIVTMIFVAVAYFLPEWLGITGKKAQDIMAHQQGEEPPATKADKSPRDPLS